MVAFAGGVIVGGVAALLFAPKRGEELRREIKEHIDDAKERVKSDISCCASQAAKVVEEDISVSVKE